MSKAKLTSVIMPISVQDTELSLQIEEDGRRFKATPLPKHMAPWRKLVALFDQDNISATKISLNATDVFAAEAELRRLLFRKDGLLFSPSFMLHYAKDRARFTLRVNASLRFAIESSTERISGSNPRTAGYVIALQGSEYCSSATVVYDAISVDLTAKYSATGKRLTVYNALVDLY